MSLPERIQVSFGETAIAVVARDLLGRTQDETMSFLDAAPRRPWSAALASVEKWISARFNRLSTVHVELADRHAHYLVLPWRTGLNAAAEWQAYGVHRFREVYGSLASDWIVQQADPVPGHDVLMVAVHREIVDRLRTASGSMLRSVEPACIAAFNQHRRRLGRKPCWFVKPGPERFCAVLLGQGRWRQVRNEYVATTNAANLESLLGRVELEVNTLAPLPAYVASAPLGGFEEAMREIKFLEKPVGIRAENFAAAGQ